MKTDRVVLSLPVVFGNGRIVELAKRAGFRFERYVDNDGEPTSAAAATLDRPVFATLDEALDRAASWAPGHACTAKAFALVPHNLSKDGMRAKFAGGSAFWCNAAAMWIGNDLRAVGDEAARAHGVTL